MKLYVFTVYDAKAEYFMQPLFWRSVGEALRSFEDEVQNPESMLSKHPGDFTLYQIGEYDQATGGIIAQPPFGLGTGLEYVAKPLEVPNGTI